MIFMRKNCPFHCGGTFSLREKIQIADGGDKKCNHCGQSVEIPFWADFILGMYTGLVPFFFFGPLIILVLIGMYAAAFGLVGFVLLIWLSIVCAAPIRKHEKVV
ncbi:hypothetical protein [Ruegeria sp. HKCCD7255]|uniref:hypothetical protein n=1 Tax=Ruegeria sp. HKCCD7255 TaxID=2683004 RepID=UPI0014887901|nr:hypothetical protein [Ruegeria sp. HKCCD7255]